MVNTEEAAVWGGVGSLVAWFYPCVASLRSFSTAQRDVCAQIQGNVYVPVQLGLLLPHSHTMIAFCPAYSQTMCVLIRLELKLCCWKQNREVFFCEGRLSWEAMTQKRALRERKLPVQHYKQDFFAV